MGSALPTVFPQSQLPGTLSLAAVAARSIVDFFTLCNMYWVGNVSISFKPVNQGGGEKNCYPGMKKSIDQSIICVLGWGVLPVILERTWRVYEN
jgi:hypothetical protein